MKNSTPMGVTKDAPGNCIWDAIPGRPELRAPGNANPYLPDVDGRKRSSVVDVFDKYGAENCSIELIDYCPCKSKTELERKEFMFINSMPCVNKQKIFQRDFISEVSATSQPKFKW